jgi:hypothetical protein
MSGGRRWLTGLALVALGSTPSSTSAQTPPIELGIGVSRISSPVAKLSDTGCAADNVWAPEAHVGFRFSRAFAVQTVTGMNLETGVNCADPFEPPATGPGEQIVVSSEASGYPFLQSDLRLAFEPSSPSGPIWLRAYGGYGRMWSKDIGYWLAGGGVVFGAKVESVIDFEWNWFDVPFDRTTRTFQDGVQVSEATASGSDSHRTFRLRAFFRWRP